MPYDPTKDADIQAAIDLANASTQEIRGAKKLARDQAYDDQSLADWAKSVGQNLYGMKDVGLFHDIIPGAVQSAKQAFTLPGRAYMGQVPEDQMIPEALNLAGMVTLGAGAVPAEMNALRAGASLPTKRFSMADAVKQEGVPSSEIKQGFSSINRPHEEWNYAYTEPKRSVAPKDFDPNMLKPGDVFVPLFGDRTISGRTLTEIGGNPLAEPVVTEGGPTYMLNPNKQIWASGQSVISGIANKAENALRASEKLGYKDPSAYGIYVPMGKASGDFSTHTADAIVSMLPNSPITKKAEKAFDDVMKEELPDFPGVKSPDLREYLMAPGAGAKRIIFSKMMDKKNWREAGFPDVGEARFATTDPNLLSEPDYAGGYTIGKINRESPVIKDPVMGHRSYPVALGGDYVGGLPVSLHKDLIFPNWTAYYDRVMNPERANYGPAKYKSYANMMAYQPFGPRTITDLQERIVKAQGKAGGGAVDDADVEAALYTARQHFEGGGVAITQDQIDQGINAANASTQELRGAKQAVRDQAASNQSWGDWAKQAGQTLYGMKDIGLFHDIVPGAIESVKQGFTAPARAYQAGAEGRPWSQDQMIGEALNTAGMVTLGAGAIPMEANALRAGAGMYSKAERAALGLPMEKMQGPQALAMLTKAGIGPEELKWTGLADKLPQTPQLTKQQLVDMIRQNDVQLNEIVYGGRVSKRGDVNPTETASAPYKAEWDELDNQYSKLYDDFRFQSLRGNHAEMGRLNRELQAIRDRKSAIHSQMVDATIEEMGGLGNSNPTRFATHSLKPMGGRGYKETVLTLPSGKTAKQFEVTGGLPGLRKVFDTREEADAFVKNAYEKANSFEDETAKAEILAELERSPIQVKEKNIRYENDFSHSHWPDVYNPVVHIRENMIDHPQGTMYNMDELQSDYGQAGRDKGFRDPVVGQRRKELRDQLDEATKASKIARSEYYDEYRRLMEPYEEAYAEAIRDARARYKASNESRADYEAFQAEEERVGEQFKHLLAPAQEFEKTYAQTVQPLEMKVRQLVGEIDELPPSSSINPAPYVTNTSQWADLGIKKALTNALDNNAEIFTWTPGDLQAKRFDLSTEISALNASPNEDGTILLRMFDPEDNNIQSVRVEPKDLPNYVGKEISERITNQIEWPSQTQKQIFRVRNKNSGNLSDIYDTREQAEAAYASYPDDLKPELEIASYESAKTKMGKSARLEGVDLQVGGEGMKDFYGNIVPKRISEVLRKAAKVKPTFETFPVQTPQGTVNLPGFRITDEIRAALQSIKETEGGYFPHMAYGGKVDDSSVNKALQIAAEASV